MKFVIFDMDGTLLDTMYYWRNVLPLYAQQHGLEIPEIDAKHLLKAEEMPTYDGLMFLKQLYSHETVQNIDEKAVLEVMENVYNKINLSARGYDRILRVARTIADIEFAQSHTSPTEEDGIVGGRLKKHHLTEAIQMRVLDRKYDL